MVIKVVKSVKFEKVVKSSVLAVLLREKGDVMIWQEREKDAIITTAEKIVDDFRIVFNSIASKDFSRHSYIVKVVYKKGVIEFYKFDIAVVRENKKVYSIASVDVIAQVKKKIVRLATSQKMKGKDAVELMNRIGNLLFELFGKENNIEKNNLFTEIFKTLLGQFIKAELYVTH